MPEVWMLEHQWRIDLLGGLRVYLGDTHIHRFRTQKTASLLAFLAFNRGHIRNREEIAGILWPETDVNSGRASLRTSLASLRDQLEPPGFAPNSVLAATRSTLGLNPDAVVTDLMSFAHLLQQSETEESDAGKILSLRQAVNLYRGPLLEGYYDEWIDNERRLLAHAAHEAFG